MIHEPQGKTPAGSGEQSPQDHVTILGKSIAVTYAKGTSEKDRQSALAAIKAAAELINNNASKLTDAEKSSIANITTIDVDPTASRSSADVSTGTFHANSAQLAEGTPRFATDIAHDGFHITQWKSSRSYTGGPAESEATYFQIGVGRKVGLSEDDIKILKNYADHIEKFRDYWHAPVTHSKTH